jgi:hypothetical protein
LLLRRTAGLNAVNSRGSEVEKSNKLKVFPLERSPQVSSGVPAELDTLVLLVVKLIFLTSPKLVMVRMLRSKVESNSSSYR